MKTILAIALVSLASAGAYAAEGNAKSAAPAVAKVTKASRLEARKACQDEGKKGKELKSCVREKLEKVHT
jgi:hypothetical protein